MKAGWEVKALGEVCTLQRGFDLPTTQRTAGIYPLVTSSGPTDTHNEYKVEGPGVITGRSGSIGNVYYVEDHFWPLNTALYVKDFYGNDPKFVWYLLQYFDLSRFSTGAGVPTLNRNDVHGEMVHAPASTDEQKRIVEVLDAAFEGLSRARAHTETNLQNARELFDAAVAAIFDLEIETGEVAALENVTALITKGSSPKWQGISYVQEPGVLFVTSENVGTNEILLDAPKYVEDAFNLKDRKSILQNGDVLTNIVGASIGRTAVFERDDVANINQAVCMMRCKQGLLLNHFLAYLLNSPFFKRQLHAAEVDNARANLSLTFFRELQIPLPSVERQAAIVDEIHGLIAVCRELQSHYRAKLADLDALRQALLQKAFAGELT